MENLLLCLDSLSRLRLLYLPSPPSSLRLPYLLPPTSSLLKVSRQLRATAPPPESVLAPLTGRLPYLLAGAGSEELLSDEVRLARQLAGPVLDPELENLDAVLE